MELLDIVDEKGNPTGETVPREVAHREGIRHRTAHVWIFRRRGGVVQILLQKRSDNKDSDPGCYDISSYCGQRRFRFEREFHGSMFCDNQVSNVYALWLDREEEDFILQEEEVSGVRWMDFADCVSAVRENRISHCIYMEELELLKNALHLH